MSSKKVSGTTNFLRIIKILARTLKIKYCECSAKSGHNVQEIAQRIKDDLLEQIRYVLTLIRVC